MIGGSTTSRLGEEAPWKSQMQWVWNIDELEALRNELTHKQHRRSLLWAGGFMVAFMCTWHSTLGQCSSRVETCLSSDWWVRWELEHLCKTWWRHWIQLLTACCLGSSLRKKKITLVAGVWDVRRKPDWVEEMRVDKVFLRKHQPWQTWPLRPVLSNPSTYELL